MMPAKKEDYCLMNFNHPSSKKLSQNDGESRPCLRAKSNRISSGLPVMNRCLDGM